MPFVFVSLQEVLEPSEETEPVTATADHADIRGLATTVQVSVPEMAVRLSIAFGTSSESWLTQQTQYDLWHAEQRRARLRVVKLAPA